VLRWKSYLPIEILHGPTKIARNLLDLIHKSQDFVCHRRIVSTLSPNDKYNIHLTCIELSFGFDLRFSWSKQWILVFVMSICMHIGLEVLKSLFNEAACLGVWLRLLFKVFFMLKSIKMIFFLFFKNYFWDQRIKTIQNTKKIKLANLFFEFLGNAVCTAFPNTNQIIHAWNGVFK
jgi:hypothetical protein